MQLRARFGQNPHVGDIRGRGLFWGLELVPNGESKAPFEARLGLAGKLKTAAFAEGLICYPMPGTRGGKTGDHVLLAPPFIASEAELAARLMCCRGRSTVCWPPREREPSRVILRSSLVSRAKPPRDSQKKEIIMEYAGLGGLIVLVLNIWAIVSIIGSGVPTGSKVLWTLLVLVLPIIGFVIWILAGPRSTTRTV